MLLKFLKEQSTARSKIEDEINKDEKRKYRKLYEMVENTNTLFTSCTADISHTLIATFTTSKLWLTGIL